LSAEPGSAAGIKDKYVDRINSTGTQILAGQIDALGRAQPESVSTGGWATLRPLTDDNGQPYKMPDGRNQYYPDFNSSVDPLIAQSVINVNPYVKNDQTFGADVTGAAPSTGRTTSPASCGTGMTASQA
jgi:hypothetical protein